MTIKLIGENLKINELLNIATQEAAVSLADDPAILDKIHASRAMVNKIVADNHYVYGINTNFGGLSNQAIIEHNTTYLQENLVWGLHCGIGNELPSPYVRATMALRINALMRGASGIRLELLQRYADLLNHDFVPVVYEHGSIGASGDLVPMAHIAGSVIGMGSEFEVYLKGERLDALTALSKLGIKPTSLLPKEGLALVNGTSCLTAIAAISFAQTQQLFDLTLQLHGLIAHAMEAELEAFEDFPHQMKPHPGQIGIAKQMHDFLKDSPFVHKSQRMHLDEGPRLIQDRYSIRCLPQFLGPIWEGMQHIEQQIEIEMNSSNDNPLLDSKNDHVFQAGNFLGQHMGMAMDQMRSFIALAAKHLDAQISILVTPPFNRGLSASLAAPNAKIPYGLNGLQICLNSIVPRLLHLGQGIVQFFPTHAETFNQNINSQGFASANLARESVTTFRECLAVASIFAIQAVELRTFDKHQTYAAREYLPAKLVPCYEMLYQAMGREPSDAKPLIENNTDQSNSHLIRKIAQYLDKSMG